MTFAFLQAAPISSDLATYTFSSQNLGVEAADRYIIVTITSRKGGTTPTVINSVTIGGVTATEVAQISGIVVNTNVSGMFIANVPTGATGDIVVAFNNTMARCGIGVYRATGIDSPTPFDVDENQGNDPTANLNIPAGGFAIATAVMPSGAGVTTTGLTENYEADIEFMRYIGASDTFVSEQVGLTITFNGGENVENVAVFASWSPIPPAGNIKTVDTVAIASVKTVDSIAIANVKQISGVDN